MVIKRQFNINDAKIKFMPIDKILISIDRLTRFKYTEDKYLRVFKDIITTFLIDPKIKKQELDKMEYEQITSIAQHILNTSIAKISNKTSESYAINKILQTYENEIFKLNEKTQFLLDNKIDYDSSLMFIDEKSPLNLKWLKTLSTNDNTKENRKKHKLLYPIEKIIIVEGATEEILLPKFAQILGFDFCENGIAIIPAGGKNQVVKLYYKLIELIKIPIFVLLDKDALENSYEILAKLRKNDKIHLLQCGEFEDLLPDNLIKKALDYDLKNISSIELEKFNTDHPTVKTLEEVYKNRGFHEFKKVEFANIVYNNISSVSDISEEILEIIQEIQNLC